MIFARSDFVSVCNVHRIIIWFCDVGAQPQLKVEIGGFVSPPIITISANSRIISETGRKGRVRAMEIVPPTLKLRRDR